MAGILREETVFAQSDKQGQINFVFTDATRGRCCHQKWPLIRTSTGLPWIPRLRIWPSMTDYLTDRMTPSLPRSENKINWAKTLVVSLVVKILLQKYSRAPCWHEDILHSTGKKTLAKLWLPSSQTENRNLSPFCSNTVDNFFVFSVSVVRAKLGKCPNLEMLPFPGITLHIPIWYLQPVPSYLWINCPNKDTIQ